MSTQERTDDRTTAAPAKQSDRTVHLSPEAYGALLVAQCVQIEQSMTIAIDYLGVLRETADPSEGGHAEDAELSVRIVREDLRALDQLGWPHWGQPGSDESSAAGHVTLS